MSPPIRDSVVCLALGIACLGIGALCTACATTPAQDANRTDGREALSLLLPSRIEIVEPFTRTRRPVEGESGDGIELLLRAVNSLGNPGLMIVGDVRIELYEFVPGTADHKGARIDGWDIPLETEADQRAHWNQLTQMYEFHLEVNAAALPPTSRFVLQATYNSPLGEHFTDEMVLVARPAPRGQSATAEWR